jgi:hypothetical protein
LIGSSSAAIGCTGGLDVRKIFALPFGATLGERTVAVRDTRLPVPTSRRADFEVFLATSWALFAPFFAGRRAAFAGGRSELAVVLLIGSI